MVGRGGGRVVGALGVLLLLACSSGAPAAPEAAALAAVQALRFPIQHDVSTLDPAMIDSESEAAIAQNVFDGLLKFDSNLNISPDIAAALPIASSHGLTYTFTPPPHLTLSNRPHVTS